MHVLATLPTRNQGEALLEFFFEEVLWLYHIVHVPSVRKHFDKLYTTIENNQLPDFGALALISTIYALSAYFSSPASGLFFKHSEATTYCHKWTLLYELTLHQPLLSGITRLIGNLVHKTLFRHPTVWPTRRSKHFKA